MIRRSIFFIFCFIIFIISCTTGDYEKPKKEKDKEEYPDIITIKWETGDDSWVKFYTNDINMTGPNGMTYWIPKKYQGLSEDVVEVDAMKITGSDYYGYGIIFCIQDEPDGSSFVAKSFYCVLIRVDGYYQIIKVVDKKQHILKLSSSDDKGWNYAKDSNGNLLLKKGKGVVNRIKVVITASEDGIVFFNIYFNGSSIYSFKDAFNEDNGEVLPLFKKVDGEYKYGFIVTVSPSENFPYIPVEVRFKQIVPDYTTGVPQSRISSTVKAGIEDDFIKNRANW